MCIPERREIFFWQHTFCKAYVVAWAPGPRSFISSRQRVCRPRSVWSGMHWFRLQGDASSFMFRPLPSVSRRVALHACTLHRPCQRAERGARHGDHARLRRRPTAGRGGAAGRPGTGWQVGRQGHKATARRTLAFWWLLWLRRRRALSLPPPLNSGG